jgi:hypothetical protein
MNFEAAQAFLNVAASRNAWRQMLILEQDDSPLLVRQVQLRNSTNTHPSNDRLNTSGVAGPCARRGAKLSSVKIILGPFYISPRSLDEVDRTSNRRYLGLNCAYGRWVPVKTERCRTVPVTVTVGKLESVHAASLRRFQFAMRAQPHARQKTQSSALTVLVGRVHIKLVRAMKFMSRRGGSVRISSDQSQDRSPT